MNHLFVVDQFSNAIKIQSAFLNIVPQHFTNLLEEKEFQNKYELKLQFLLYRIDCLLHIIYGEWNILVVYILYYSLWFISFHIIMYIFAIMQYINQRRLEMLVIEKIK
jgi:hypothetical protein